MFWLRFSLKRPSVILCSCPRNPSLYTSNSVSFTVFKQLLLASLLLQSEPGTGHQGLVPAFPLSSLSPQRGVVSKEGRCAEVSGMPCCCWAFGPIARKVFKIQPRCAESPGGPYSLISPSGFRGEILASFFGGPP